MQKHQFSMNPEQFRCRGASVSLEQLLNQRFVARLLELDYQARSRTGMAGTHLSRIKGRGVDFEEFRAYQPGDDIRTIDWRVTARTGRPFVKVFREERERPVIIAVDQSLSMGFGSQVAFKSVIAAQTAAILCWTTVDIGDRVGGVVFDDQQQSLIRPRRGKRSALRFLDSLASANQRLLEQIQHPAQMPEDSNYLKRALEQCNRVARPGSVLYLISDFRSLDTTCIDYLQHLALHNSVTCLMVYDDLETHLPLPGTYSITDGRTRSTLDTSSAALRRQYETQFQQRLADTEATFMRMKIPMVPLKTSDVVLEQLETWKHRIH